MHHCIVMDEFDPHGHLFLLCIKEKQQDYFSVLTFVLAHMDFQIIIFCLLSQPLGFNRWGINMHKSIATGEGDGFDCSP